MAKQHPITSHKATRPMNACVIAQHLRDILDCIDPQGKVAAFLSDDDVQALEEAVAWMERIRREEGNQ